MGRESPRGTYYHTHTRTRFLYRWTKPTRSFCPPRGVLSVGPEGDFSVSKSLLSGCIVSVVWRWWKKEGGVMRSRELAGWANERKRAKERSPLAARGAGCQRKVIEERSSFPPLRERGQLSCSGWSSFPLAKNWSRTGRCRRGGGSAWWHFPTACSDRWLW